MPTKSTGPGKTATPRKPPPYRLPDSVHAREVALHLELDPASRDFRGEAEYALELSKGRRRIELHAAGLRIARVRLHLGDSVLKGRVELRPETESVALHFERTIPAGPARLELGFRGRVRRDLRGLYRSEDDESPWIATQLCPTDARRLFPCLDEPGTKARYRIAVTAPSDQAVISNAPLEAEESRADRRKTSRFEATPPLSSYLVAIAVGPFEAGPEIVSGTTAIRVHALPGRRELTSFAREAAAASLTRLEAWFDMPHPYPKLDLVALPAFAFGAMENAGAVFFRDSILLLDPTEASLEDRKRAGEVIAHELSHMWFGNLVTMRWWNDLWLNEAFATWMAYEIVDDWQPEWRIWLEFGRRRETALELDALASSHPIAPAIKRAEEAQENFDAITYTKGASVLRMLEGYLGREVFREGIRLYMRRHREGNACAADLWAALGEASGVPVEKIVAPWTLQTGYPLVQVARREKAGHPVITLAQQRFLAAPPRKPAKVRPRWTIPWVGRTGRDGKDGGKTQRHLLTRLRDTVSGQDAGDGWLYGNAAEAGFFRVEHAGPDYAALLSHLEAISAMERIGLVGHEWALARAGRVPIERLLDLVAALGSESDPDVLMAVENVLARLLRRLAPSAGAEVEARLRAWIAVYYGAQIDATGLDPTAGESDRDGFRRARIFSILGGLARAETVLRHCREQCARHFDDGLPLPAQLGDEILRIAASQAGEALYEKLCEATRTAATPQARRRTLFALAEFRDPGLLARTLDAALDGELAPAPDRAQLIALLLAGRETAAPTWSQLQKVWRRLERSMPPILLARLAGETARALPPSESAAIRAFFKAHPLSAGDRVLRQVAEELAIARRFERESGPALAAYLGA